MKVKSLLLASVMAVGTVIPITANAYSDVATNHWAYESIKISTQKGWFNGFEDGSFKPGNTITRAEVAKVLALAVGVDGEGNTFTDIEISWAEDYITSAGFMFLEADTMNQTMDFRPTDLITRQETLLALMLGYGVSVDDVDTSVLDKYEDTSEISKYIKPYVAKAVECGIMTGKLLDGKYYLEPNTSLTRAEFVALLERCDTMFADMTAEQKANQKTSQMISEVYRLVNAERAKEGLTPYDYSYELQITSMIKNQDMIDNNYFSHADPSGYNYAQELNVGENIGAGYSTAEAVVDAWMHSVGHKANIMDTEIGYTKIGVAFGYGANTKYGEYYTKQFTW